MMCTDTHPPRNLTRDTAGAILQQEFQNQWCTLASNPAERVWEKVIFLLRMKELES